MQTQPAGMLARLAGNHALKQDLSAALRSGRLPHSILLVGEPGCGAGFAARCLAADYLYPAGGPHAEAVLRGEDAESITVRGEEFYQDIYWDLPSYWAWQIRDWDAVPNWRIETGAPSR